MLWAHSHLVALVSHVDVIKISVQNLDVSTRTFKIHGHDVEHGRLSCSIWSEQCEDLSFLDAECVIVDSCHSVAIDLEELVSFDWVFLILPNVLRECLMIFNILAFPELVSLNCFWLVVSSLEAIDH